MTKTIPRVVFIYHKLLFYVRIEARTTKRRTQQTCRMLQLFFLIFIQMKFDRKLKGTFKLKVLIFIKSKTIIIGIPILTHLMRIIILKYTCLVMLKKLGF